jgi:hypothetical protein
MVSTGKALVSMKVYYFHMKAQHVYKIDFYVHDLLHVYSFLDFLYMIQRLCIDNWMCCFCTPYPSRPTLASPSTFKTIQAFG